jgi:hypothetical protein
LDGDRRLISLTTASPCAAASESRNPRVSATSAVSSTSASSERASARADRRREVQLRTPGEMRPDRGAERLHRVAALVRLQRRLVLVQLIHPQHVLVGVVAQQDVPQRARLAVGVVEHRLEAGLDLLPLAGLARDAGDDGDLVHGLRT